MQAHPTPVKRKYALTKLGTGDYLLPSNDGVVIWRIASHEDGPSHGLEEWPRDRTIWGVWKWVGRTPTPVDVDDIDDWERWSLQLDCYATRREAIDAALGSV